MGAWIEIKRQQKKPSIRWVAPHMGAWIEILIASAEFTL